MTGNQILSVDLDREVNVMQYQCEAYKVMLERMYSAKLKQADRARLESHGLMYLVLKAEAEAISAELRACHH